MKDTKFQIDFYSVGETDLQTRFGYLGYTPWCRFVELHEVMMRQLGFMYPRGR